MLQKLDVEKLKEINSRLNNGRGMEVIRQAIACMESNHKNSAIDIIMVESDKIRAYKELVEYFRSCEETNEYYKEWKLK